MKGSHPFPVAAVLTVLCRGRRMCTLIFRDCFEDLPMRESFQYLFAGSALVFGGFLLAFESIADYLGYFGNFPSGSPFYFVEAAFGLVLLGLGVRWVRRGLRMDREESASAG
jgi:hypothetical protein